MHHSVPVHYVATIMLLHQRGAPAFRSDPLLFLALLVAQTPWADYLLDVFGIG